MKMNIENFRRMVAEESDVSLKEATRVIDSVFGSITKILEKEDTITIPKFGKFYVRKHAAREVFDPQGGRHKIPPLKVGKFSASDVLNRKIRGAK